MTWQTKKLGGFSLLDIVKFTGWLLILGISVYALFQSNESIGIARQALIVGQRPHLAVKPVKFDENNKYIFVKKINQGIDFKVRFEITNTGNSTARSITTSDIYISVSEPVSSRPELTLRNEISCDKPGKQTLVPGESTYIEVGGIFSITDGKAIDDMLGQITNNEFSLPFNIEFYYDSDTSSLKGKTILSLVVWPDKVVTNYSLEE